MSSFSLTVRAVNVGSGFAGGVIICGKNQQEVGVVLHLPFCARLFARDGSEQAACCLLLWDPARSEVRIGSRGEVRLASLSFVKG